MIIFTQEDAVAQVAALIDNYPGLGVLESNSETIRLQGSIRVYRTAFDYTLDRSYIVEIIIPVNSSTLPSVKDVGGSISDDYPHRYVSGELCLETETIIRLRFIDGFSLVEWMDEYVEPYYFTYEYYCRYGVFPFGDRPHGLDGLINTYQDLFSEDDISIVWRLMSFCVTGKYRGHANCPCGSGKRTRDCHGKGLLPIMTDPRKVEIVKNNTNRIIKELVKHESTGRNTETAE